MMVYLVWYNLGKSSGQRTYVNYAEVTCVDYKVRGRGAL